MNNKSCIFVIKSKYELLTKAEKKIASFILENAESVISMSASELADASGTAGSAVVRCCKSLGFKGYTELKLALAAQLSRGKQLGFMPNIYPDDKPGDILDKIFSANVKTLHDTAEHINRKMLCSVIDMIGRSNSVYIYGIGTSAVFVQDFQYRLMQCGYTAFGMCDVPGMKISTMNIKPGDSAIGISHSGRTVATVEALRLAKEKGAETACITSCHESPIVTVSDYPIEIFSDEVNYPMEAISSRIAHMSVIDSITVSLSARDFEKASERAKETYKLVNTVRYGEKTK